LAEKGKIGDFLIGNGPVLNGLIQKMTGFCSFWSVFCVKMGKIAKSAQQQIKETGVEVGCADRGSPALISYD
jgi:hypothetical protein